IYIIYILVNETSNTYNYTLSLHDALPILKNSVVARAKSLWTGVKNAFTWLKNSVVSIFNNVKNFAIKVWTTIKNAVVSRAKSLRSEEHTSELQSRFDLVCRLLLEKKKKKI